MVQRAHRYEEIFRGDQGCPILTRFRRRCWSGIQHRDAKLFKPCLPYSQWQKRPRSHLSPVGCFPLERRAGRRGAVGYGTAVGETEASLARYRPATPAVVVLTERRGLLWFFCSLLSVLKSQAVRTLSCCTSPVPVS